MVERSATAAACANIAFVKYWGNRDDALRLPSNGSISMSLEGLESRTTVTFDPSLQEDSLTLSGRQAPEAALQRVSHHLDLIRDVAGLKDRALVASETNFPSGVGLASSASAFAALTVSACVAAGLDLDPQTLSRLARRGSGSACRSIFGGFVESYAGDADADSYASQIAPPEHWELVDLVAIVSRETKQVGSTLGHSLAATSPLQAARVKDAPRRLDECRDAILTRDFAKLAAVAEQDSNMMHSVMLSSSSPLIYWAAETLTVMHAVTSWREEGRQVCYTVDAGPNVHCICPAAEETEIHRRLQSLPGVLETLRSRPGGPAHLV